ncbi:EAL domain-containing protein [Paenibacillus sp. SI8]|uniref:EAL domain-containing protein n=1 Tax=unclassified Paenibacillus TaxID=185978 RepID=UPI003465BCC3
MKSNTKTVRIAVYTPHIDGEYFGKILAAISKEIQHKKAQLTVIQTQLKHPFDKPIETSVFVNHCDACILILDGASESTLHAMEQLGKPIVSIANAISNSNSHSVVVDNRAGAKEAVLHLIDHGHTEIAFVGMVKQYDQMERYEAYKEALSERNLAFHPDLVCLVSDNMQQGGIDGVQLLAERRQSFTAAVAATDRNAIGFISAWRERNPHAAKDIAVVGFDDIEQASYDDIALTTVKQSHTDLAIAACSTLFDMLEGRMPKEPRTLVPTQLIIRASCGCTQPVRALNESLLRSQQIAEELSASLRKMEFSNYELIQGLIRVTSDEEIELSNLFVNSSHWGYLALWDHALAADRKLVIDRVFSKKGDPVPLIGERMAAEDFPSVANLPASISSGSSDLVYVHPILSEKHDWGYLVLVGPLETLHYLFVNQVGRHTYMILAAALERESLLQRIRTIAERLQIVSETTNDGIWDWNLVKNTIEYNISTYKILGSIAEGLTEDPQTLVDIIHPDDLVTFRAVLYGHLREGTPYQAEFRIRKDENTYLWLYSTGDAIRDHTGTPLRMIGSISDITKKKEDEARIVRLAYHDTLTGLPNRRLFMERLEASMKQCDLNGSKLAVILIDLDRFKFINDTLGHQAGDKLLQHIAEVLSSSIRPGDTIARLGGDEFIILLSAIKDNDELEHMVATLIENISAPLILEGQPTVTSASLGACVYPDQGIDSESLIKYADMAMYKAKENGRNQMFHYTQELSSKVKRHFNLSMNLRRAIENDEFILHYQPQIDLRCGTIIGIEALLRWNSPEHGLIYPADFIPFAEETGLIIPISNWVLRAACLQLNAWQAKGLPTLSMSINISAQHFRLATFSDWIKSVLEETGTDPNLLCLELTETTAVQDIEHSVQMLKEVVSLGLYIAIDDFGTGHSSLLLLKRLPIHMVKIDKSFIQDIASEQSDASIVKAVIAMSHSLGLSVIAEGVEGGEQLELLKLLDCDYVQGYYTGKPMQADQFESYLNY